MSVWANDARVHAGELEAAARQRPLTYYEVRLVVHVNREWTDDEVRELGDAVDDAVAFIKDVLPWGPHPAVAATIEVHGPRAVTA